MPIPHEASASSDHHSSSSLLASIGNFLHSFHPTTTPTHPLPSDDFDSVLSQRLSMLLPDEGSSFVSLSSLSHSMAALLATQTDLKSLLPPPLSRAPLSHIKMMDEFVDRSVKLLDVCNSIREHISEVEGWRVLLEVVLQSLGSKRGCPNKGKLRRASKVLAELQQRMEMEGEGEAELILTHNSSRFGSRRAANVLNEPQRWRSCPASSSASQSHLSRQLQAMGASLTPPKLSAADVEENLCAAIYALNVVSIFFLSTILAAFPTSGKSYIVGFSHPRNFLWASPLLQLQDHVSEETRKRGKKSGNGRLWELDQVFSIVRRLSEITGWVLSSEEFPLSNSTQEEIRHLVKQLRQHVEELDRDLKPLHDQIREFHKRLIDSRTVVLDRLSYADV